MEEEAEAGKRFSRREFMAFTTWAIGGLISFGMGIPAIAWDGVRPAGIFPDEFPRADFLYDNLVMLPVHQSLRRRDLELIAESVERVAGAGQVL